VSLEIINSSGFGTFSSTEIELSDNASKKNKVTTSEYRIEDKDVANVSMSNTGLSLVGKDTHSARRITLSSDQLNMVDVIGRSANVSYTGLKFNNTTGGIVSLKVDGNLSSSSILTLTAETNLVFEAGTDKLTIQGDNMLSTITGGNTSQYLSVYINNASYKIALNSFS